MGNFSLLDLQKEGRLELFFFYKSRTRKIRKIKKIKNKKTGVEELPMLALFGELGGLGYSTHLPCLRGGGEAFFCFVLLLLGLARHPIHPMVCLQITYHEI